MTQQALRELVELAEKYDHETELGHLASELEEQICASLIEAIPALKALLGEQREAQGADMVLVPREPTTDMVYAACDVKAQEDECDTVTNLYKAMLAAAPVASQMGEPVASSTCPICGKDSPHYHGPEEATMYNAKFVGVGPQFVQDALQHVYAAMDAMRRKGARENYDRGYNAGFNVSADILEAALKDVKAKLGFMAERAGEFPPIIFDAEAAANKAPPLAEPDVEGKQ